MIDGLDDFKRGIFGGTGWFSSSLSFFFILSLCVGLDLALVAALSKIPPRYVEMSAIT